MTIGDEYVRKSVIIEIFEAGAPAQILKRNFSEAGNGSDIGKQHLAHVLIKRVGVTCEVRHENVEKAIAVVITHSDAHSRLRASGFIERCSRKHAHLGESAIVVVMKHEVWVPVVRDINVRPTVIVEIAEDDAETVIAGIFDPGALRRIAECSVPVVVKQNVGFTMQPLRSAKHIHTEEPTT